MAATPGCNDSACRTSEKPGPGPSHRLSTRHSIPCVLLLRMVDVTAPPVLPEVVPDEKTGLKSDLAPAGS
jgi:hypothetical protein